MDRSTLLNMLKNIISEAIEVDESEVMNDSSLIDDLGIESVDMLYIKAKVESVFSINWDFGSGLTDPEATKNGKITEKGAAMLKEQYPGDEFKDVELGPPIIDIIGKITVNSLMDSILRQLV